MILATIYLQPDLDKLPSNTKITLESLEFILN